MLIAVILMIVLMAWPSNIGPSAGAGHAAEGGMNVTQQSSQQCVCLPLAC